MHDDPMNETPRNTRFAIALFVILAVVIVAIDLWTKEAIFQLLEVELRPDTAVPSVMTQQRKTVIAGFFDLEYNYNYGAFSGWFSSHTGGLAILSAVASLVLITLFVVHVSRHSRAELLYVTSLALLLGGTVGNLWDRAVLNGVRDWIKWYVVWDGRPRVWPNFNIADSAICTGVGCLILLEVIRWRAESRAAKQREADGKAETT